MPWLNYESPHEFSRKLIEIIGSKFASLYGKLKYGTIFAKYSVEDLGSSKISNGFSYSWKDIIYNRLTGKSLNCFDLFDIFFNQRLRHMVLDKMNGKSK